MSYLLRNLYVLLRNHHLLTIYGDIYELNYDSFVIYAYHCLS